MSTWHDDSPRDPGGDAEVLRITTLALPGTAVVCRLEGEADQEQRQKLENALTEAVKAGQPRLVVDLAGLSFCDSSGLNALLQARQDAGAAGIRLVLAAPAPLVRRLLEITGTDQVFTVRDSVHAALASTGPDTG
ncbi:STAS domain-containing protein [Streptomyces sp. NRRL S-350]|uniref:STAS domain-containing protein n=1 Tax=Streptomyces sp. NRRL S-350 TaxID=1463902 RepID=UPI00068E522F|nr:STAS domain-containing protein [Streptomyces sp. NRRL S-350]